MKRRSVEFDIARLAVETGASTSTVRRWWLDRDAVTRVVDYALRAGAVKLGIRRREAA